MGGAGEEPLLTFGGWHNKGVGLHMESSKPRSRQGLKADDLR